MSEATKRHISLVLTGSVVVVLAANGLAVMSALAGVAFGALLVLELMVEPLIEKTREYLHATRHYRQVVESQSGTCREHL